MTEPLAYRLRPKDFDGIVGQEHLVGPNGVLRKMLDKGMFSSCILYGPAGCGKTTIAKIIASKYEKVAHFNASIDNKATLKTIVDSDNTLCIIDEIHRLKKDIQDFLLPSLESGKLRIIGLTTENPYRVINPAIRSRCHIYRLNEISKAAVVDLLKKTAAKEGFQGISEEIFSYLATASSCEIRTALNMLEIVALLDEKDLNLEGVKKLIGAKSFAIDQEGENYYNVASAMIKSIRGSDPDAAIHYLARLLQSEDLEFICRRLQIAAYEDVGLANPNVGPRVYAAVKTALDVGLPEARIPLAYAVIDLAVSPKSNSTYQAINEALDDLKELTSMAIPPHILNSELKSGRYVYKYPHDYPGGYVKQQYLPDELLQKTYYKPKTTGSYEKAVGEYLKKLRGEK